MKHFALKMVSGLSRLNAAVTRERLRRELLLVDERLLANAGLTRQSLIDSVQAWPYDLNDDHRLVA